MTLLERNEGEGERVRVTPRKRYSHMQLRDHAVHLEFSSAGGRAGPSFHFAGKHDLRVQTARIRKKEECLEMSLEIMTSQVWYQVENIFNCKLPEDMRRDARSLEGPFITNVTKEN